MKRRTFEPFVAEVRIRAGPGFNPIVSPASITHVEAVRFPGGSRLIPTAPAWTRFRQHNLGMWWMRACRLDECAKNY